MRCATAAAQHRLKRCKQSTASAVASLKLRKLIHLIQPSLKHRLIHAVCYELLLLCIGTPLLSLFLARTLSHTTLLWLMMTLSAIVWNMLFNHGFEKLERWVGWRQRGIGLRIAHALGFEGGLLLFTVPMIAWMLQLSWLHALCLDLGLALCIVVYTFFYQWAYDLIMAKYFCSKT
jgi:uncharacterized membrane protein